MRVPAVCAYPKLLEVTAADNSRPVPPQHWAHESRRHLVRIVPPIPGLWPCFTHSNCVCNDLVAATNRVVGVVPPVTDFGFFHLRRGMRRLILSTPRVFEPWDYERTIDSFHGKKRKRYEAAYESLKLLPLSRKDSIVRAFTKAEKFNPYDKVNPDPRMIQARHPRYNLELARFMRPLEHSIYGLVGGRSGLRLVVKGMNQVERASLLIQKWAMFDEPVVVSLDASRWDKHVQPRTLSVEHAYYQAKFPSNPELARLLAWQCDNVCVTSNGVRYKVASRRMSGDMNTACGNCLGMVNMVSTACRLLRLRRWDMLDDGDDCLLMVEAVDLDLVVRELPLVFLEFGQELKVENVAHDVRSVVFCQSRVCYNGEQDLFVRNWRKVLSQACCGVKHWGEPKEVRPMLTAIGLCELALGRGIPILQAFAEALIRNGRGERPRTLDVDEGLALRVRYEVGCDTFEQLRDATAPSVVTDAARVAFEQAWGVSPDLQRYYEALLSGWTLDSVVARQAPPEWDWEWKSHVDIQNEPPSI